MKRIYADYNATTPSPRGHFQKVVHLVEPVFGNPASIHSYGREAKVLLEEARERVSALFGGEKNRVVFTSGATEANNLAIQGVVFDRLLKKKRPRLILSSTEHSSVSKVAETLAGNYLCSLQFVRSTSQGIVDQEHLLSAIDKNTDLVALIHVNNETGAVNPVEELAAKIRNRSPNVHIHIDAVQSYGKCDLSWVAQSSLDTVSVSAHKIGGFKGVGCLYKHPKALLHPLMLGGGHEKGWRSGSENIPGIASFGLRAADLTTKKNWIHSLEALRRHLIDGILQIPGAAVHGDPALCLPTTVNFHIDGISAEELMLRFDVSGIAVASGSACSSGGGRPSPILMAMGLSEAVAAQAIRVSFGEESLLQDAEAILKVLVEVTRSKSR